MREFENTLKDALEKIPVGKKLTLNFRGITSIVDIEMTFKGGWVVTQTVIPGRPFELVKGEDGYLLGMNITMNPFDGIKEV